MNALRFSVSGRVQGVWFRAWTEREARALGLAGWVRNTADGRVEGFAQGAPDRLELFVTRLHRGPPAAAVDAVDVDPADPEPHATFEIRR